VLELCVLAALRAGPSYGYALAQDLELAGLGTVKGGTLYPLLGRLEAEQLVEASWRVGDSGPGRKYFALTDAGREALRVRTARWQEFVEITAAVVHPAEPARGRA
jgi:PadR family transcriptional regulator PadR